MTQFERALLRELKEIRKALLVISKKLFSDSDFEDPDWDEDYPGWDSESIEEYENYDPRTDT